MGQQKATFHIPGPMCRLMRAKKGALLPKEYPIAQTGQKGQKGALTSELLCRNGRMREWFEWKRAVTGLSMPAPTSPDCRLHLQPTQRRMLVMCGRKTLWLHAPVGCC